MNTRNVERTRVSESVLDKLSMIAAREVDGVEDVDGLVITAAVVGGIAGGVAGFVQGGALGAVVGASIGSGVGALVADSASSFVGRRTYHELGATQGPSVHLKLTAEEGVPLNDVVRQVHDNVRAYARDYLAIELDEVKVVITERVPARS